MWSTELGGLLTSAAAGEIIGLTQASGGHVYPGFQFVDGWPPAALVEAWRLVAAASDPWTAASWAATPDDALAGRRPIDASDAEATRVLTFGVSGRRSLSGLARKFAHVSRGGGQAAREVGRASVLARSLWRSSRVNFHWNGPAICS
jgi:hypothetical protein